MKKHIFLVLLVGVTCYAFAQNSTIEQRATLQIQLPIDDPQSFFEDQRSFFNLNVNEEMVYLKTVEGANSYKHYKYQQVVDGIPVFGGQYIVHAKEGLALWSGGFWPQISGVSKVPGKSADQAIRRSLSYFKHTSKSDFSKETELDIQTAELCWVDRNYPKHSGEMALGWKVTLRDDERRIHTQIIVDAQTGQYILESPQIAHQGVPATGQTKYYGEKSFICDSIAVDKYELIDPTRADGIYTFDENLQPWTNDSKHWDFTNQENEVAIDLHWAMAEFYDMMLSRFGWDGIDNEGGALISTVSAEKFINAFWNGEYATFGRGDCNHGPLTTLEVVAHELMHGVTDYTSDLIYNSESGAINESMSDVFGKACEYYSDPAGFDWMIGESFLLNQYGRSFRSMEDPNTKGHPKYYGGEFWFDGGGVHTNSSIGNHWFYRLVEGGTGTNEVGYTFDMEGIGMDKALQIVFLTQRAYLHASSDYNHYYETSQEAAIELYGDNSPELEAVREAWKIVGLPGQGGSVLARDLSLTIAFEDDFSCVDNEFVPLVVSVSNEGSELFDPTGTPAEIFLDGDMIAAIGDTIMPGETWTRTFDDVVFIDYFDTDFYIAQLVYSIDLDNLNNRTFAFYENYNPNGLDLEFFYSFDSQVFSCSDEVEFSMFASNASCIEVSSPISAEAIFRINGVEIDRRPVVIPPMQPGGFQSLGLSYNHMNNFGNVEVELVIPNDIDNTNNSFLFFGTFAEEVVGEFSDDFESLNFGPNWAVESQNTLNIKLAAGNAAAASTGDFEESFAAPCAGAAEMIEQYGINRLGMCVDASGLSNPRLSFRVNQFRNDSATIFPELSEYTAVMSMEYSDGSNARTEYFHGQKEGEWVSYSYALPANFVGDIIFRFACLTGTIPDIDIPEYWDYDVVLLDDVVIDNLSSVINSKYASLVISPIPAHEVLAVSGFNSVVAKYQIIDMTGKLVESNNSTISNLDIGHLAPGMYYLKVESQDGSEAIGKFIKQ